MYKQSHVIFHRFRIVSIIRRDLPMILTAFICIFYITVGHCLRKSWNSIHWPGMSTFAIQIGSDWPQMGQILDFIRSVSVHWCIIEKWDALCDLFFLSYLFHVNLLCLLKMNLWIYKYLCLRNIHCKYCLFIYWCFISIYLSKAGLIKVDLLLPRFISFHLTVFY